MVIVINTSGFDYGDFHKTRLINNLLIQLAEQQKAHQFLLIKEKTSLPLTDFPRNVAAMNVAPGKRNRLLKKLWLLVKLPSLLKKVNASVLVSFDQDHSLSASLPQIIIMLEKNKQAKKIINNKSRIVVESHQMKNDLMLEQSISQNQIDLISCWPSENFIPASFEKSTAVKSRWSDGKEFFFCNQFISKQEHVIFLLKAFSHFKKRQQSGFKLLLLIKPGLSLSQQLSTYKYRTDVRLFEKISESELLDLTNSAYGVLHPFVNSLSGCLILESMAAAVPVIVSDKSNALNFSNEVLKTDDNSSKALGEKMIRLYIDEKLRSQIISKGKTHTSGFSIQKSANELWEIFVKAVQ